MENGVEIVEFQTRKGPKYFASRVREVERRKGFLFKRNVVETVVEALVENTISGRLCFIRHDYLPHLRYETTAYFLSKESAEECARRVLSSARNDATGH